MHSRRFPIAIAALAFIAASCEDSASSNGAQAELTVIHATQALGAVEVLVDGESVIASLEFGSASGPIDVPSGTQRVVVRAGTDTVGDFETNLTTEHVNAVVIANGAAQVAGTIIPDTGAVAVARANLRLVNVVGPNDDAPVNLDILINFPGVGPDSTARLGGLDTRIASYSSLLYFDAGSFRLRYVPQGTTDVLTEAEFDIAVGEVKVAVLERAENGTYKVTIVSENE
ncbi:MAG TPA: DUF4397 domain-containing protein [Gemmatimonadaceae bacterium]|nr:DUF4397 domain-containing protein [Gemmatimonadaceae bacterium]